MGAERWYRTCVSLTVLDENDQPVLDDDGQVKERHSKLFHDLRRTAAQGPPTLAGIIRCPTVPLAQGGAFA